MPPAPAAPPTSRRWRRVLWVALLAHVGLGVARLPGVGFARRWREIDDYQTRGAAGYFLDGTPFRGADAVAWLLANVPADGAVVCRGDSKGVLEFLPGLLAPRLVVREHLVAATAREHAGHALAGIVGEHGEWRRLVVVANGDELQLEGR